MPATDIKLTSSGGGEFDCHLVTPSDGGGDMIPAPGIVMAADIFGVGPDLKAICGELAGQGFCVSAPDFFWRSDTPGPLTPDDQEKARARAQPRHELIEQGMADLEDAVRHLKAQEQCNGNIAVAGFCYGGPYAILGPARIGLKAGFSYHGTNLQDWADEIDAVSAPMSIHWGTEDHAAPPEVQEQFTAAAASHDNLDVFLYPGVLHGYTGRSRPAWDEAAYANSFSETVKILNTLR